MSEFLFIVSRTAPQTYRYLLDVFVDDMTRVVFDRRVVDRLRSPGTPRIEPVGSDAIAISRRNLR